MKLADIIQRVRPPRRPRTAKPLPPPTEHQNVGESDLAVRRDWLSRQFTEMQWDLGGIAYEMASRDHFRLDVIVRQAAKLQEIDAELAEVERMLRLEDAGAAGNCSACGALHARGAVFCWQCGNDLLAREAVGGTPDAGPSQAAPPTEVQSQPAPPQPEPQALPPERQPETQPQPQPQSQPLASFDRSAPVGGTNG